MIPTPLQSVNIGDSCYFGGSALTCLLDQLVAAFGGPGMFGVLAGGMLFVVFYVAGDGGLATPTVVLTLAGTVLASMAPPQYREIALGVVVIGVAAALWGVVRQYVLSGAANT